MKIMPTEPLPDVLDERVAIARLHRNTLLRQLRNTASTKRSATIAEGLLSPPTKRRQPQCSLRATR